MSFPINNIIEIDCLQGFKNMPDESVDCIVTSPPYWQLRNYGVEGQIGMEASFYEYIDNLCNIFDEAHRVLKSTGSVWINLGDTYSTTSGHAIDVAKGKNIQELSYYKKLKNRVAIPVKPRLKPKSLCMIPDRFAIEMINRGWILRNQIIWHKPNCMPSSAKDRFTVDFEKIYFFTKNTKYYFEQQLEIAKYDGRKMSDRKMGVKYGQSDVTGFGIQNISKGGKRWFFDIDGQLARNKRSVWTVPTKALKEAHFAAYPEKLIIPCILAGCPENGVVLDPFMGSGTTALVAKKHNRNYIGFELNPDYIRIANKRLEEL